MLAEGYGSADVPHGPALLATMVELKDYCGADGKGHGRAHCLESPKEYEHAKACGEAASNGCQSEENKTP